MDEVYRNEEHVRQDDADVITTYAALGSIRARHIDGAARERAGRRNVTGAWPVNPRDWECLRPRRTALTYAILTTGGRWVFLPGCRSVWDGLVGIKREIDFLTPVFSGER